MFQDLSTYMWLVTTILDSAIRGYVIAERFLDSPAVESHTQITQFLYSMYIGLYFEMPEIISSLLVAKHWWVTLDFRDEALRQNCGAWESRMCRCGLGVELVGFSLTQELFLVCTTSFPWEPSISQTPFFTLPYLFHCQPVQRQTVGISVFTSEGGRTRGVLGGL